MEPLLRITTIPMKYELKIQNAKLEYKYSRPEVDISRQEGGLYVKSQPTKLHVDSYDARNSVCPTTMESVRQSADKGKASAYESTAESAKEGALLLDPNVPNPLDQIISQRSQMPTGEFGLKFLPTTGPDIEWSDPDLTMKYQTDKLSFELKAAKGDFEFTPGNVEFLITQMPDVQIEYIGGPMYVPPSAADMFNHTQVDVRA